MGSAAASPASPAVPLAAREDRYSMIAIVLSFAAGATDAFAFLLLGGIFTANMTGNLILVSLVQRTGYPMILLGASVAVVVFAATVYFASRAAPPVLPNHRRLVGVLVVTTVAQIAVLLAWILSPHPLAVWMQCALIALSAVAMAGQTVVARRIETRSGVTTTFVTGTLTNLMADFADRKPQAAAVRIGVILALTIGALCGALCTLVNPALGAALPVLPSIVGVVLLATAVPMAAPVAR